MEDWYIKYLKELIEKKNIIGWKNKNGEHILITSYNGIGENILGRHESFLQELFYEIIIENFGGFIYGK